MWRRRPPGRPQSSTPAPPCYGWQTVLLLSVYCVRRIYGCALAGADIGYCEVAIEKDSEFRNLFMPFCGSVISYTPCVPKYQVIAPSREFPEGRFYNNTVAKKDAWVRDMYNHILGRRKGIEKSKTLKKAGHDENGLKGDVYPRFTKHKDCATAFKNIFCWMNFPRCDENGESLVMCKSACENFFTACNYPRDMWRCGGSEFMNGYEAEKPNKKTGQYLRDFFPGQPFRANKFDKKNNPVLVCTPSIKNAASGGPRLSLLVAWLLLLLVFWLQR